MRDRNDGVVCLYKTTLEGQTCEGFVGGELACALGFCRFNRTYLTRG